MNGEHSTADNGAAAIAAAAAAADAGRRGYVAWMLA